MGKLSFGEKIALLAGEDGKDGFPEDEDYETSAKVVDEYEDVNDSRGEGGRSVLRTKNVKLLEELDERYAGTKTSRKKLDKSFGLKTSKPKVPLKPKLMDSEDEEDDGKDDEDVASDNDEDVESNDDEELDVSMDVYSQDNDEEDGSILEGEDGITSENDEESTDEESDDGDEAMSEDSEVDAGSAKEEDEEDMQTLSAANKASEIEKATCTQNQLRIWDALLEVRIRMQRMLLEANKLPQTETLQKVIDFSEKEDIKLSVDVDKTKEAVRNLIENLAELQENMIKQNPETLKGVSRKRKGAGDDDDNKEIPSDEEITSSEDEDETKADIDIKSEEESEDEEGTANAKGITKKGKPKQKKRKLKEYDSVIQKSFKEFIPYRNETIQKWNEKTQLSLGRYGKKHSSPHETNTVKQIEHLLSNKEKLIKRTQVKRSTYETIGKPKSDQSEEQIDVEIFDDDDFYHQLLRDLIERKTSNVNDPVQLSRHWLELQKLRSKLKRKVDTKASKGRKLRYDVHSKLVNFMAPHDTCVMSESAVKELMSSLFGKLK